MSVREFACESDRTDDQPTLSFSDVAFSDVAPFITSSERMHILSDFPAPSLKTSWEGSHRPLRTSPAFSLEAAMN